MKVTSLAPQRSMLSNQVQSCLDNCQHIIGYRFNNLKYIRQALNPHGQTNQRLALVGDKVADAQLVARWHDGIGRPAPNQWHRVRNFLVSNQNLAEVGVRLRIHECTLTRCGGGRKMATTIEAIIGAVWLDSGRNPEAVDSVMDRIGLTKHPVIRSLDTTFTSHQPPLRIQDIDDYPSSSRSLPDRFFVGHHLGLLQLLFRHSKSFMVQQPLGQQVNQPPYGTARQLTTERPMRPHLSHIFSATRVGTDPKYHASGEELSPSNPDQLPKEQAPAQLLADQGQTNPLHDGSAMCSPLPAQQPATPSENVISLAAKPPTCWHDIDTEWGQTNFYIWSLCSNPYHKGRKRLIRRLGLHREVLLKLPGRSQKNMPNGFPTDGLYLMARSTDESFDRLLSLQTLALQQQLRRLESKSTRRKMRHRPPEEASHNKLLKEKLKTQLVKLGNERLQLWLPQDAREDKISVSPPEHGPASTTLSDAPESASPASVSTAKPRKHNHLRRPGSVLWTTHAAQHTALDWKQYLSKPASENQLRI